MFRFWKKTAPKALPSNPGIGVRGVTGFSNGQRNWSESYDLPELLESVLKEQKQKLKNQKPWLVVQDSGFMLLPQLVELQPLEKGGVRTVTTIQVHHPVLVADGVFEYQHSTGNNTQESVRNGFDLWAQTDLITLLDALESKPKTCTTFQMTFPEKDGKAEYFRRAVLGPVTHLIRNPPTLEKQGTSVNTISTHGEQCESHEFCPCCLLTNSLEAFKELIEGSGFYGLRLFAARDANGVAQADCRVNGNDWEKGAEALRKYVTTWPEAGYEFRKQYVVLHSIEKEARS